MLRATPPDPAPRNPKCSHWGVWLGQCQWGTNAPLALGHLCQVRGQTGISKLSHSVFHTAPSMRRVEHNIKGQGIYAYVVLADGTKPSAEMKKKLNDVVKNQIGSFAVPETIHWAPGDSPTHPLISEEMPPYWRVLCTPLSCT